MLCHFLLEPTKDDEPGAFTEARNRAFANTLCVKVLTSYPGRCLAGGQWSLAMVISH